ncbi:GYF domain-containing protein [Dorcoceras hygrometricum]|uniref:GYF domain-containing protein n=1 Tax=Dorcoceras hygrometricum TaxID=472368 RepID=A0A2Z7BA30_9LAMI|nr:GYF domain-containing protein [Dorcoceras hygrometricum]
MRIRPPELETRICDAKYHVSLALSVIPRGSWRDVARRFNMIRWANHSAAPLLSPPLSAAPPPKCRSPAAAYIDRTCSDQLDEEFPSVLNPSSLLVQIDGGRLNPVVDLIGGSTAAYREEPDARASGDTALSSPCWDLLALMRRVVNYHSSWVGQRKVEMFDASGIRVWCKVERVILIRLFEPLSSFVEFCSEPVRKHS